MKKLMLLLGLPVLAVSSPLQDYARQWPLTLAQEDAGAYRVVLDNETYRTSTSPLLQDIDVINAQGETVPAAVFNAWQPLATRAREIQVPWFPLPNEYTEDDITGSTTVQADLDSHGRILRLKAPGNGAAGHAKDGAFLVDLSRVREDVEALEIDWTSGTPRNAAYRVEVSDDLQRWMTLQDALKLVELSQGEGRIQQNEVPLSTRTRYVRLLPRDASPVLPVQAVRARLKISDARPSIEWLTLPARRTQREGREYFEFELDGRYPIQHADVQAQDNSVAEWTLESRDSSKGEWQYRVGPWVGYEVRNNGAANRSASQELDAPIRDRHWRLSARGPTQSAMPSLRLGYQPEVVVFLAQGDPPYRLVAGAARAIRAGVPMQRLMDGLRVQRGKDWQPTPAYLGPSVMLAGDQALAPALKPVDWKTWSLWAVLVAGALLVAGFAIHLLRKPSRDQD